MENSTFGQKSSDFKINGCQNKKEMKTGIEGIRSIQEAAIMTQSTDFSENRIKQQQQLQQHLQQQQQHQFQNMTGQPPSSSIYSIQQQTGCYQNTTTSLTQYHNLGSLKQTCNCIPFNQRGEDSLEDMHSQIVARIQKQKTHVRELEQPNSYSPSQKFFQKYAQQQDVNSGNKRNRTENSHLQTVFWYPEEELLQGDGCAKPFVYIKPKTSKRK